MKYIPHVDQYTDEIVNSIKTNKIIFNITSTATIMIFKGST